MFATFFCMNTPRCHDEGCQRAITLAPGAVVTASAIGLLSTRMPLEGAFAIAGTLGVTTCCVSFLVQKYFMNGCGNDETVDQTDRLARAVILPDYGTVSGASSEPTGDPESV